MPRNEKELSRRVSPFFSKPILSLHCREKTVSGFVAYDDLFRRLVDMPRSVGVNRGVGVSADPAFVGRTTFYRARVIPIDLPEVQGLDAVVVSAEICEVSYMDTGERTPRIRLFGSITHLQTYADTICSGFPYTRYARIETAVRRFRFDCLPVGTLARTSLRTFTVISFSPSVTKPEISNANGVYPPRCSPTHAPFM